MSRDVALLNEMAAAVNASDAHRYAAVYEPDAQIVIHGTGVVTGRAAIERYERELLARHPGTRIAMSHVWSTSRVTIARYGVNFSATSKTPATGHEGAVFYDFSPSGLIAEEHRYFDSLATAVQAGAFPALSSRAIPALASTPAVFDARATSVCYPRASDSCFRRIDATTVARDVDGFAQCFVDGGEIDDHSRTRPDAGAGALRSWFTAWCGAFDDVAIESTRTVMMGDVAFNEDVVRASMTNAWSGVGGRERATRTVSLHRARIAQLDGDRISRLTQFVNRRELQR